MFSTQAPRWIYNMLAYGKKTSSHYAFNKQLYCKINCCMRKNRKHSTSVWIDFSFFSNISMLKFKLKKSPTSSLPVCLFNFSASNWNIEKNSPCRRRYSNLLPGSHFSDKKINVYTLKRDEVFSPQVNMEEIHHPGCVLNTLNEV